MKPCEFIATQGLDDPRLIKVCRECKYTDCEQGICETYIEAYYKLYSKAGPRRKPMRYSIFGVKATRKEWAQFAGINERAIRYRMEKKNMTIAEAIGFPRYSDVLAWEKKREAEKDG